MTSVLLTVPTGDAWIRTETAEAVQAIVADATDRHAVTVEYPNARPFEHNLHQIVAERVIPGAFDYWCTFDADNPPMRNPLDLITYDKDVIGCPTPVWHYARIGDRPIYFNAYRYDHDADAYREYAPQSGLQRVDAVGTGCLVIAARVFDHPDLQRGCFQRRTQQNGTVDRGNDIAFCERATRAGFEIWAHFGYLCRHFCEVDLMDIIQAYRRSGRG